MILVTGGTGHLGLELVPLLLNRHHGVRVLTRDAERARLLLGTEVELAVGDVRQAPSLTKALRNVEVVVSAVTGFGPGGSGPASVDLQGNLNLIRTAESAGVKDFVLLSMHGVAVDHPMELMRMKYQAEQALRASRLSWTIVRPTVFMELWAGLIGEPIKGTGRTTVFGRGDNPINFVSVKDLARFVELAVSDSTLRGSALEVGGPENLSVNQVVRAFEVISGQKVKARHIPRPVMRLASVALRPFRPDIAGMIGAGLAMDTTDMTFDAAALQQKHPEIRLTRLDVVARNLFDVTPSMRVDGVAPVGTT